MNQILTNRGDVDGDGVVDFTAMDAPGGSAPLDVALGDVDDDGDLDAFLGNQAVPEGVSQILTNRGDVDGDGSVDFTATDAAGGEAARLLPSATWMATAAHQW